jgi:chaperonin GroEL
MFLHVFEDARRMMTCTIGPPGGNTLVTEPYAATPIFPTKDGFRVMNNHVYDDVPYEATFRMIRDLSSIMNQEVGDGTTSVVIIAGAIYKEMIKYIKKNKDITPYGVKNIFNVILEAVNEILDEKYIYKINELSHEGKVKIYEKIATIAANNDSKIGKTVAGVYAKSGSDYTYIDIQESMNEKDITDVNVGFEITSGYIDRHMVTSADGISAEYNNPLYLIIDGPLIAEDLPSVQQWVAWSLGINKPLVIIASEYEKEVFDFFVRCRTTGFNMPAEKGLVSVRAPLLAIILDTRSEYGMSRLHDLECALGAKALTTNNGKLMEPPGKFEDFSLLIGRSDSVLSKPHYIRIRGGAGIRAEREARIAEIERDIAATIDSSQHGVLEAGRIEMLRRRAGMLQGEMHIIRVGGDSYKEKRNRALIYEDAVMAVKNCIKHGITLGGNVSIYHAIARNKKLLLDRIIKIFSTGTHNVMINSSEDKLRRVASDILAIVAEGSLAAFKAVFDNATRNNKFKKDIFRHIKHDMDCVTFNLINNNGFERFCHAGPSNVTLGISNTPDLLSPGNMDKEILRATFSILGLFLTSNQLITVHTKKDNKV